MRAATKGPWSWKLAVVAALATVAGSALVVAANSGRHRTPSPEGLVFQVEAPEVTTPFERIEVFAVDRGGPAVAVFLTPFASYRQRRNQPDELAESREATCWIHRYPSGERIEELVGARARALVDSKPDLGAREQYADFDGDGVVDELDPGLDRIVAVRSGVDRRVLFEDDDALDRENPDRARFLGDLDGDGCAELAIVHPREDRSSYDWVLSDALLGVKSWVTIVSGARIAR